MTKHIEIQYHWICEVVNAGQLVVKHCPTEMMIADMLTKSLGKAQFIKLRNIMGLKTASNSGLEGACQDILVTGQICDK